MPNKYTYTARQRDTYVDLCVYRNSVIVNTTTIMWSDLPFITVFTSVSGSAKALTAQFKRAHVEGRKLIALLHSQEKTE